MARSSYIYILEDSLGAFAAFTVKHELESYIKRENPKFKRIIRLPDGVWNRVITTMTLNEEGKVK